MSVDREPKFLVSSWTGSFGTNKCGSTRRYETCSTGTRWASRHSVRCKIGTFGSGRYSETRSGWEDSRGTRSPVCSSRRISGNDSRSRDFLPRFGTTSSTRRRLNRTPRPGVVPPRRLLVVEEWTRPRFFDPKLYRPDIPSLGSSDLKCQYTLTGVFQYRYYHISFIKEPINIACLIVFLRGESVE